MSENNEACRMSMNEQEESKKNINDDLGNPEKCCKHKRKEGNCEVDEYVNKCHNKYLGFKGEKAAAKFLESKGYEIIDKNWKCKFGEADIVALYDDNIVFIEVKTRTSIEKGLPEDAVGPKKRKRYECIAAKYLQLHDYVDMPVRFDVIAILVLEENKAMIRHHVNAFGIS